MHPSSSRRSLRTVSSNAGAWSASALALVLLATGARAEGEGSISVTVERADGKPAAGVRVTLVELRRSAFSDERGTVLFENVAPGEYHLQAASPRFGEAVREVTLAADGSAAPTLVLGYSEHSERIVVTATRTGRGSAEVVTPVQVLDRTLLTQRMQPTIGETLAHEPGVSSSYFGPGASRPIIRGQGGGRVRVLEGGLGVGDASTTSPDHAVGTDAVSAERIEILRGPATLLYGSSALGGVVSILDQRVPEHAPPERLSGALSARYGSAAEERSLAFDLHGGAGHFAWHVDALDRDTEDYDIPDHAVTGDPASPSGTLPNSSLESRGGALGASWVGAHGFVGVSAKGFDTNYGIPAELEEGAAPRIDLEQRRYDVRGGLDRQFGPFSGLRFSGGVTDYRHRELEGGEVGTTFFNDSDEVRLELTHGRTARVKGVLGIQYAARSIEAVGAEAFLPPSDSESLAAFVLEEFKSGSVRYELGARVETTDLRTSATVAPQPLCADPRDREFAGVSGSFGVVWSANERYALGGSASRTVRPPNAEELLSCGEHLATLSFEVGDPDLGEENSLGVDVSLRKRTGRVTGDINLFAQRYDDYILELLTGASEPSMDPDGLPVYQFAQADARFYGAEVNALVELFHSDEHDLDLSLSADGVRADLTDTDQPLPRIPPQRAGLGLQYRGDRWHGAAEVQRCFKQDRVARGESETDGYTMVNASVGYRMIGHGVVHDLMLRGTNLADEDARNHASRLKDLVPLPGVDIGLVYRLIF